MQSRFIHLKQQAEALMFDYMAAQSQQTRRATALRMVALRVKTNLLAAFSNSSHPLVLDAKSLTLSQTVQRARITDRCMQDWAAARRKNDFSIVAPALQNMVDSVRIEARAKSKALGLASPYHALLFCKTPGFDMTQFESWCTHIEKFCRVALAHKKLQVDVIWPPDDTLGNKILALLGHNEGAAETEHPLCLGTGNQTRIGLRRGEDAAALILNALHEGGHASLRKNLPEGALVPGTGMDEAMALIIENHAGKGYAFATYLSGVLGKAPMEIYTKFTALSDKPIRTNADEVRYPLDVILRCRIEKALIDGDLKVKDIPAAWRCEYKNLTGMDVKDDNEGALQDVHWFGGEFGWFPNYLVGQLAAAQLYAAVYKEKPEIPKHLAQGDFAPLLSWFRENIYRYGDKFNMFQLVERATGAPLGTAAWERHIRDRYHALFPVPKHSPWRPS